MRYNSEELKKPNHNQRQIMLRRKMDPANYLVIKDTPHVLYVWDMRLCKIRRIQKWN